MKRYALGFMLAAALVALPASGAGAQADAGCDTLTADEAQVLLDSQPTYANRDLLDPDGDGIACEPDEIAATTPADGCDPADATTGTADPSGADAADDSTAADGAGTGDASGADGVGDGCDPAEAAAAPADGCDPADAAAGSTGADASGATDASATGDDAADADASGANDAAAGGAADVADPCDPATGRGGSGVTVNGLPSTGVGAANPATLVALLAAASALGGVGVSTIGRFRARD